MARDDKPIILGLTIAFPILAIASVIFRFEARRTKRLKLEADDWAILAALIFNVALTIDVLIDSRLGNLGGHENFDPHGKPANQRQYAIFGQTTYAFELLVWPCVGLTKISVLLLYKRIFATRTFRILVWYSIGFVVAWTVAFEFALMFSCLPISAQWDPTINFTCVHELSLFTAALVTDVMTDGLIVLLPIYNTWKLQLSILQKLAVTGMFGLGALVTVTGIIRLHFLTLALDTLPLRLFNGISYSYAPAFYWSVIETNVGIVSACLPTLRSLYEGYQLSSIVTKLSSRLKRSRSTTPFNNSMRLNSVETGLSENVNKIQGHRSSDPYAIYDELDSST